MADDRSLAADIVTAARTLARVGLVTAFGHVSARITGGILITPAADLANVTEAGLIEIALADDPPATLPAGAPAEAWAHLQVYAIRPDVAAIARAQPPAAFAAASLASELPILHGQAAWLGRTIPVHQDARLLRTPELAAAAARKLASPDTDALLLRGNGALTCGRTPGDAVARMWLLSVACTVWLTATSSGTPTSLDQAELDSWRAVQSELLPRLWRQLATAVPSQPFA